MTSTPVPGIDRERSITSGALSAAAALVHFAAAPAHFEEWAAFYVLFMVAALLQVAYAVAAWQKPTVALLRAGAVLNLGIAAVWLVSRTAGLPFGPESGVAESFGFPDVVTTVAECLAAWLALRPGPGPPPPAVRAAAVVLVLLTVFAIPDVSHSG